jgi:hypothetical protein
LKPTLYANETSANHTLAAAVALLHVDVRRLLALVAEEVEAVAALAVDGRHIRSSHDFRT